MLKHRQTMEMGMEMALIQTLSITGGATTSIFLQAEDMLNEDKYTEALFAVTKKKKAAGKYHSVMDFLFAELAGRHWKHKCMKFYDGEAPALRDDPEADKIFIAKWDIILCIALQISLQINKERLHRHWGWASIVSSTLKTFDSLTI